MNALVPTNVQLPAHLSDRIGGPSTISESMTAGLGGSSYKTISKRGSRFRIRDGAVETVLPSTKLRAIIVGASPNVTKVYYKGGYDPKAENEDKKPDCYSNDGVHPAADAKDQQAQLCASCQHNEWGSKISESGSKMKACADRKRLAIISADDSGAEPEVYLFQITPSELTDFRAYGKLLESKGWPPELVITELSFDTDKSYPKIEFNFGGFIDQAMVPVVDSLVGSDKVREITGEQPLVAQVVEQPKAKPSPVKTKAKEEVIDAEVVEVEVLPAPKKGFGGTPVTSVPVPPAAPPAPPVVASSKLANDIQDILNDMQDEDDE